MNTAARILIVVLMVVGTGWVWAVWGQGDRAMSRLTSLQVVAPSHHARLLHSTGYRRASRHVFECPPADLLTAEQGGIHYRRLDLADENQAQSFAPIRTLLDDCLAPPVDWQAAEVSGGIGKGQHALVYTVKSGSRLFVVLQVF